MGGRGPIRSSFLTHEWPENKKPPLRMAQFQRLISKAQFSKTRFQSLISKADFKNLISKT
jgi:hypothetical protein